LVGLPHLAAHPQRAGSGVRLRLAAQLRQRAAAHKASLPIIGALLGHTQPQTTARYAHLAADPLQETAERVGVAIERALKAKPGQPARVVPLRPSQRSR
jgi:hypothetical protein